MRGMIKSLFFIMILLNILHASTNNVRKLQKQFHQDVIELNVFQKRFGTYLERHCNDNLQCYKNSITKLKSWKTVKQDNKLQYYLNEKNSKLKYDATYWNNLIFKLGQKNIKFNHSQFVSVIDLERQFYIITLWDQTTQKFYFIGKDLISSGNIYREKEIEFGEDHYLKTPAGVFKSKQGWRSEGKKSDDNISLGYGKKNRYVFYFGKQKSVRYNIFDKNKQKIYDPTKWKLIKDELNFAVHSHESSKPLGIANSHGCIRMSDELNRFLDTNSILHKNMIKEGKWLHKYAHAPTNSQYHKLAGEYLIVFDKIKERGENVKR